MDDDIEMRRKRALYRATHRGTKELDVMIGGFARAHLQNFSAAELAVFENLLVLQDPSLQAWILEGKPAGFPEFAPLIDDIRVFHGLAACRRVAH